METNHFAMLYNIGELSQLFSTSRNLKDFLNGTIDIIRHHLKLSACGIYIYNDKTNILTLEACFGFNYDELKKISFIPGAGMIGKALDGTNPILIRDGLSHPDLNFISPLLLKKHGSFLVVPLRQGNNRIGIIILQRQSDHPFKKHDVSSLRVMTSQLSNVMVNVKMLMSLDSVQSREQTPGGRVHLDHNILKGKAASNGFAFGRSKYFKKERMLSYFYEKQYKKSYSLKDFRKAIHATEKQLEKLQKKIMDRLADLASLVFTAHLLILKDQTFINEIEGLIVHGVNAPDAVLQVGKKFLNMFALSENLIIKEKQQDLEDLLTRILHNLIYNQGPYDAFYKSIIIASDLYPSDILKMSAKEVTGIILLSGGVTSHVAILARSLQIPLVILNGTALAALPDDTLVLIDAELGNVHINPEQDIIKEYEKYRPIVSELEDNKEFLAKPAVTRDGIQINLYSNINLVSDIHLAAKSNCDGVGLYRTEFAFLMRSNFPTEEEQFFIYCKIVEGMQNKPITFRTLDVGGDKLLAYYDHKEMNPFLGFRSTRFMMKHKELFKQQIRAILRAGAESDLRIMFPMISSIDEFIEAKDILLACIQDLTKEKIKHHSNPKIGIMVEVPSIIDIIEDMAKEVDFFSIGTNDLIQFLIAVDRTNESVSELSNPLHPSVLRNLKTIVDAAINNKIDVSICGDMAHEEKYLPFLIGIGLRNLSINPIYFLKIKKAIHKLEFKKAKEFAHELLPKSRLKEIKIFFEQEKASLD